MKIEVKGGDTAKKLEQLKEQIKFLKSHDVAVGIPAAVAQEENKGDLPTIAAALEYGTSRIPARPFLRRTIRENGKKYGDMLESLRGDTKETAAHALELIAEQAQSDVQDNIVNGNWVKNTKAVYERKLKKGSNGGNPRPLIDKGRLRQSIAGVVVKRGI